jgi:hypothetical protein
MVAIDRRHQTCCICRQEPTSVEHRSTGDDYRYQCPRCGTFLVTGTTYALLWDTPHQNLLPYLSAFTRQASERGEEPRVDIETWRPIADGYRRTPIDTKLDRLLRYYAELSGSPGRRFALDEALQNYSLFAAYDTGEVQYLIDILKDQNAIKAVTQGYAQLTRDGWRQLNPRAPGGTPGSCFVAMAFDPRLDGAYETGIAKAVRNCGLTVTRVDRVEHNGYVTDLIMAAIRQAQVTIADVTLQRMAFTLRLVSRSA